MITGTDEVNYFNPSTMFKFTPYFDLEAATEVEWEERCRRGPKLRRQVSA